MLKGTTANTFAIRETHCAYVQIQKHEANEEETETLSVDQCNYAGNMASPTGFEPVSQSSNKFQHLLSIRNYYKEKRRKNG